ncbi:hypothetical protein IJ096_01490 [Candidatus Saccharibacteria bacterium]|nr:hypothetical protein [Candidatus Saccharibacteria bacterium]
MKKKIIKKKDVRKQLSWLQREGKLHLNAATMINNDRSKTVLQLIRDINYVIDWQNRHPDREVTITELGGIKMPNAHWLGSIFGSIPNFISFLYGEEF